MSKSVARHFERIAVKPKIKELKDRLTDFDVKSLPLRQLNKEAIERNCEKDGVGKDQ